MATVAKEIEDPDNRTSLLLWIAELQIKTKDIQEARVTLKEAATAAKEIKYPSLYSRTSKLLRITELQIKTKNIQEALVPASAQ